METSVNISLDNIAALFAYIFNLIFATISLNMLPVYYTKITFEIKIFRINIFHI